MALILNATTPAAMKSFRYISHLVIAGGITINRFGEFCKPARSGRRIRREPQPILYNPSMSLRVFPVLIAGLLYAAPLVASAQSGSLPGASPAQRAEARDIFKQLIEINTTDTPKGSVTAAAKAMQKRFLDAGFAQEDMHLLGPDPNKMNLIVRMRAASPSSEKPV